MKIFCVGNSHVNIFKGIDEVFGNDELDLFTTIYIGPTIAYNFYEHHYPQVLEQLAYSKINKDEDYVMLIVGEVDCRWHLPKQAEIQKANVKVLVEECIDRYFRCYLDLIDKGYKVIIWGGHPSTTSGHCEDLSQPVYGKCQYRNKNTRFWNDYMEKLSKENNIPFISIIKYLIDKNNLTKMEYF
jgi:hypothetical protein